MASLTLTITNTALSLAINTDQNLLEHCLAADLPVTRSCRNGNCGRCDSSLQKGHVQLSDGSIIHAPAIIPLCIAHARSDLHISNIPLVKLPTHWRCQWRNPHILLLPAGRQTPPRQGDICAILLTHAVETNEIAEINGRNIVLRHPGENKLESGSASLITIDRDHHGDYSLWREYDGEQQQLWAHINHPTALAAQATYQQSGTSGRYLILSD